MDFQCINCETFNRIVAFTFHQHTGFVTNIFMHGLECVVSLSSKIVISVYGYKLTGFVYTIHL
jgi:hypothetical protein